MAERCQCAPPVDYAGIFDVDIYTCPCGHVYGDHDYQHCNGTMVLGKCHECPEDEHGGWDQGEETGR